MCLGHSLTVDFSPSPNSYQPNPKNQIRFGILSLKGERSFDWKQQSHYINLQLSFLLHRSNLNLSHHAKKQKICEGELQNRTEHTWFCASVWNVRCTWLATQSWNFLLCSRMKATFKNSGLSAKIQAGTVNCIIIQRSWITGDTFCDTCHLNSVKILQFPGLHRKMHGSACHNFFVRMQFPRNCYCSVTLSHRAEWERPQQGHRFWPQGSQVHYCLKMLFKLWNVAVLSQTLLTVDHCIIW